MLETLAPCFLTGNRVQLALRPLRCRTMLFVMALILTPSFAAAQGQLWGAVHGTVTDQQGGVLPGVLITATPADSRPPITATTNALGYYILRDLLPGQYEVKAELSGFSTMAQPNVLARAGRTLSLDLTLAVGSIGEVVTVTRDAPLLESASATTGINISGDLQRALPLGSRRNWSELIQLVPSATGTVSARGRDFMYVAGADYGSQVIQIDGADVAPGAQSSSFYMTLSTEVLADAQVKTGGIQASSPLGQGSAISMATISGTNLWRGTSVLTYQNAKWSGNNNPGGTTAAFSVFQPEITASGPLRRDRLWVVGSYRRSSFDEGVSRSASQLSILQQINPQFVPTNSRTLNHMTFLKVTSQPNIRHNVSGFYQLGTDMSRGSGPMDMTTFVESRVGGTSASVNVSSAWSSSLVSKLGFAYNNFSNPSKFIRNDIPSRAIYTGRLVSGGRITGTGMVARLDNQGSSQDAPASKPVLTFDLTYTRQGWAGGHEFGVGAYLNPRRLYKFVGKYPAGGFSVQNEVLRDPAQPSLGSIPFHRLKYDSEEVAIVHADSSDYALYVQDTWRPSSRVSITAGIRADRIARRDMLFDVVTQRTVTVGPRAGITWVLTADAMNVVHASWGKVHDAVSTGSGLTAGSNAAGFRDEYDFDGDGIFETVFTTPAASNRSRTLLFDPDGFRQPHVNELVAGYRRQFPGQFSMDVNVAHRRFVDRFARVEVNGIYEGNVFKGFRDESLNEVYRYVNNTWNTPVYTSASVQVAKQSSRLQLLASYARQWRHLTGTWQPNDPASFIQPDAFANDKNIGSLNSASISSLSGTDMANGLGGWRDHVFRAGVSMSPFNRVELSSSYSWQSGFWSGPVVTRGVADPAFGPATVTLGNGRVASNPLATPIRFAYATRGDGQLRTPDLHVWNVRTGYRLPLGGSRNVTIAIDLFNVLNQDADQAFNVGANQQYSTAYGTMALRQPPRAAQFSARVSF